MENGFFKKLILGAAAVTTLSTAEAQSPIPKLGKDSLNVEETIVPKTLWAKDLVHKLDTMNASHEIREIYDVIAIEREYLNIIKRHLNENNTVYTSLDYGTLLESYKKINAQFAYLEGLFPERDAAEGDYMPDGELERTVMLKELERLTFHRGS
jgi:hypothetical protein